MEAVCRRAEKAERVRTRNMYRPVIARKKSGVPVLSRKEIDEIGRRLVWDFMPGALEAPQEIDIDSFAQNYLGMGQDFQYLSHCGVYLGMTVFHDTDKVPVYDPQRECADYISAKARTVIIDRTLLADSQEHRYRFTMGHEAGHEFLHKEYFDYALCRRGVSGHAGKTPEGAVQCRIDMKGLAAKRPEAWRDRDWMEWQANAFSSAILMPVPMVRKVAEGVRKRGDRTAFAGCAAAEVSRVFNVSFEAASYRLMQLGYIPQGILYGQHW